MEANRSTSGNTFMRERIAVTVDVRQVGFHTGWMPPKLLVACCLLALTAGCLMSEQIGEPVGHGRSRLPAADVTIHFDTQFNRVVLFGRSAALAGIGIWTFLSMGAKKPASILVGAAFLGTAGWLVGKDYPSLTGYRLEVAPAGLTLKVPPDLDTLIPWESVEGLELEGFGYARIGGGTRLMPFGGAVPSAGVELPDWKTMKLIVAGGQSHIIQLGELSIEHRQIFAKALIKRADLVEE